MVRCNGRSSLASMASRVGLLAPPPETTNSRKRPLGDSTKRRNASAIERAVNAVAVATTSGLLARPQRFDELLRELASEFLAPGGLGRLAAEKWQAQDLSNDRLENRTRSCNSAIAIVGLTEEPLGDRVDHHVAGAGVEGNHLLGGAPAGIAVRFAMPPMFCTMRPICGSR